MKQYLGLLRSRAMYYWKPFNTARLTRFYRQFVGPGDLCFDIGAHVGNRTNAWRRLGADVVAVEPQPQCLAYLRRRFGRDPRVRLVDKAIGERPGAMTLHISSLTPTVSTLADAGWRQTLDRDTAAYTVQWDRQVEVEVVTLDQLIEQYGVPRFCKIDVENFELPVLRGLSRPVPALSFEYFLPTIAQGVACVRCVAELGDYEFNRSGGESQRMRASGWLDAEAMVRQLGALSGRERSGDVYARLRPRRAGV